MLRAIALVGVSVGALGSVVLMLYAGRHNGSLILMGLFAAWVLSPFLALLLADAVMKNFTRVTLYCAMLAVALVSLVIYGYVALGPPRAKVAGAFVVTPPVSWGVIAIAVAIERISGRRHRLPRGMRMS